MERRQAPVGSAQNPQFLELLLEIDALTHDRQSRRDTSYAFLGLLAGLVVGGWLVLLWAS